MTALLTPQMPTAPHWTLPEDACDCHAHVFGPYDRFPTIHSMHYEPPMAPASLHRAILDRVGVSRGVLIQPGAYGSEPAAVVDALYQGNGRLRGIAVANSAMPDHTFDAWHEAGIRGLRFNEMAVPGGKGRFAGAVGTEELERLAPRLASLGWHAEVWAGIDRHAALVPRYRASGIPIVLDHMAGVVPTRDVNDPSFQAILAALAEGWLWVKLVLCRCSIDFPNYPDLRPFHEALVTTKSDRVIWGSDWPYLRLMEKTPDVGHVLDLFNQWVPDEPVRRRILTTNPRQLYDF